MNFCTVTLWFSRSIVKKGVVEYTLERGRKLRRPVTVGGDRLSLANPGEGWVTIPVGLYVAA